MGPLPVLHLLPSLSISMIVTSVLLLSNCLYLHILGLMSKYDVYPLLIYLQLGLCGVAILGVVIVGRSVRIVSRLLFVYIRSLLI